MKKLAVLILVLLLIFSVYSDDVAKTDKEDTNEAETDDTSQEKAEQKEEDDKAKVPSTTTPASPEPKDPSSTTPAPKAAVTEEMVDVSSQQVTEIDNDFEDEENVQADLKEKELFDSISEADGELNIKIHNHSRLGLLIVDALVKDRLFVLKREKVELTEKLTDPKRASQKLFNIILDAAQTYYSSLDEVKILQEHERLKVVHGLVALQCNYVFGRVLLDGILTIREILKDLHGRKKLRNSFCRDEKSPTRWKKKRLVRRKQLLQNHYKNKFKTYKKAILARLPNEFRKEKKVPKISFSVLDDEEEK